MKIKEESKIHLQTYMMLINVEGRIILHQDFGLNAKTKSGKLS